LRAVVDWWILSHDYSSSFLVGLSGQSLPREYMMLPSGARCELLRTFCAMRHLVKVLSVVFDMVTMSH